MPADQENNNPQRTRLLTCHLAPADDGLNIDSVMLCEVIGEEIQSVSLLVAADPMTRRPRS